MDKQTNSVKMVEMSEIKKSRILAAARGVFLRYGYKRVGMTDIAEAAAISRPALYLVFKNKEEIFVGVFRQWIDETLAEIAAGMAAYAAPEEKLEYAFEIWTVRPFDMMMASPEAKALIECSFDFTQDSLREGYRMFEATILPVLTAIAATHPAKIQLGPENIAHILASAVRGFKQTATTQAELRRMIKELLALSLGT